MLMLSVAGVISSFWQILNEVLRQLFGVSGSALDCPADFVEDRTQIVRASGSESAVLTPKTQKHTVSHSFVRSIKHAKDVTCQLAKYDQFNYLVSSTLAVGVSKRLQLNANKTELLCSVLQSTRIRSLRSEVMQAGSSATASTNVVCDLEVVLDVQLSMREYVFQTSLACFFHLCQLSSVRWLLGCDITSLLVAALVFSRPQYCNAVLAFPLYLWHHYNKFFIPLL